MMELSTSRLPRSWRAALTVGFTITTALGLLWSLVWTEIHADPARFNWLVAGIIAILLITCERSPRAWIGFGPIGSVTPLWMFAYALVLLGSPSIAVSVALLGSTLHAVADTDSVSSVLMRVAGTAISLSAGGLVLFALGVHGAITQFDSVPWDWALAIVLAGMSILLLNTVIAALSMSVRRNLSLLAMLRRNFATRITAEGALLSLAPIWVIGIDFSLVLIPLLGITTILVFKSTRQAFERAHEAHHDSLTGMLNRRAFLDQMNDALVGPRDGAHPTLLLMDLNGFKEINDRLGHQIGDTLLVAFADRLEANLPPGSIAARLGGDEFAVLTIGIVSADEVDHAVNALHAALVHPLIVDGFPVTVGVSIGIASAPEHGHSKSDLLRAADVAMYKAKRMRTTVERYDTCIKTPQRGRLNLLSDLSDALDNHQLHIHFQPQLNMNDGSVDTVEALIRWQHPEHGSIPPDEFIGLAEQTDLIGPLTELVLRVATRGLMTAGASNIKLAVNVSPRSLLDQYFAAQVLQILAETGFPADRLELEVTERGFVTNAERSSYTIGQLRNAGIRIAIDDFGAGHSSYQTLRLLQVDRVKIDRDFVTGILDQPRDRLIVASLIRLSHDLGLDVVAEGVETTAVWNALAELDCDVAQGYGIAVPMAFPDLRGWLTQWNEVLIEELVS
jgi:diguanylate cyclase (GGDEF)-like protein